MPESIIEVLSISGVIIAVVGIAFYSWMKILKETNALLKEQNAELKIANAELLSKHNENILKLASMQGQIDTLKSIPLQELAAYRIKVDSELREIHNTNKRVLDRLEKSAIVLTKDTKDAALAVEQVKEHLAGTEK